MFSNPLHYATNRVHDYAQLGAILVSQELRICINTQESY